ncbi:MAG: RNA polymerase sigma-70 factor [Balneolaceae bacterium]
MSNKSAKEASEAEFKVIYFQLYPNLFRVGSYILKDGAEAEDVVQEVFLTLWEKRNELHKINDLKSYAIRTTQNRAFDRLKASKKEQERILEIEPDMESYSGFELNEVDDFRETLEIAVSRLTPKCRLVFSLSRFDGLSNDEISEYLGISKRTVETQISNALKAFRGELKPIFEQRLSHLHLGTISILLLSL